MVSRNKMTLNIFSKCFSHVRVQEYTKIIQVMSLHIPELGLVNKKSLHLDYEMKCCKWFEWIKPLYKSSVCFSLKTVKLTTGIRYIYIKLNEYWKPVWLSKKHPKALWHDLSTKLVHYNWVINLWHWSRGGQLRDRMTQILISSGRNSLSY